MNERKRSRKVISVLQKCGAFLAFGGMSAWAAGMLGTTGIAPTTAQTGVATTLTATAVITDPTVIAGSMILQSLDANGKVLSIVGTLHDDGLNGDALASDGTYTLQTTVLQNSPATLYFRVSAAFQGSLTRVFSSPMQVAVAGTSVSINLTSPSNLLYTNTSPVNVTGTVGDTSATVQVNGINAPVTNGHFLATVPLVEGVNTLTAVATNTGGSVSTATVQVTLDTTPPHITVDSPQANTMTTASTITVTGTANDIVVGTVNSGDVQVTVNGVIAQVANRTYSAANVPLAIGANTIQAVGRDRAGNGTTVTATITRINPSTPMMPSIGMPVVTDVLNLVSGNNQTGTIGATLTTPIVVALMDSNGQAVSGQPVVFTVTGNNGTLASGGPAASSVVVNTDSNGRASASWTLGQRSGAGINTVQATSSLASTPVSFNATGLTSGGAMIVVDSGNNQSGSVGQALAFPFVAVVTDAGNNRVAGVPVNFDVKQGGGTLNGALSQTVTSDSNGRAIVILTLGTQPGSSNNVVQASFAGNPGLPAFFTASGLTPGNPANTTISGLVVDNSNNPLQGVTMRLYQTNQGNNNNLPVQIGTPVQTDAKGMFLISNAPVGYFKLMADGSTTVSTSSYPTIEFDIVTVAGQNNTLGQPISLPALLQSSQLCVDATHGGTLTVPSSPGFSLTVAAGSATFPGGSKTGCISVSPVNPDKVPMSPGFGQQPKYIVTIQPVGTVFNPPAPLTLPNLDGLAAGSITEMYSYDHDLSMFVAIGTGTVSPDGSLIVSNPGVGVLKAGWHCGGNPSSSGTAGTCPACQTCKGDGCKADPSQNGSMPSSNKCVICMNGAQQPIPLDPTTVQTQLQIGLPAPVVSDINDALGLLKEVGVIAQLNLTQISATLTTQQCCDPAKGKGMNADGNVAGNFGGFSLMIKLWPPGPIPDFDETFNVGVFSVEAKATLQVGVFLGLTGNVNGTVGYRKKDCSMVAADQAGCFYGSLNTTLTPSLSATVGGSGSLGFTCLTCGTYTVAASIVGNLGQFSWPLNISAVSYNGSDCAAGLQGGLFQPGDGMFSVNAMVTGSITIAGTQYQLSRMWQFVSCTINLTNGISCQFG